jgi:ADP-ribose pyrophosphatase YjhB (NUDIX family)
MRKAARAIIIEDGKILVMFRNKHGSQYYTLVGGQADDHEMPLETLTREVKEETGLDVTSARLVFYEGHPEPYNEQYIFLCEIAPHGEVAVQDWSEEGQMNRIAANIHTLMWVNLRDFAKLPFRTPQLQQAIVDGLKKGFPAEAVSL